MDARTSETTRDHVLTPTAASGRGHVGVVLLLLVLIGLAVWRVLYHAAYLNNDAFALVAFSDGQLYEEAARDLLAHPPLGTQPFFLQGLYACLIAVGLALRGQLVDALALQLLLSAATAWLFCRAAWTWHGRALGLVCAIAWLSSASLAFYENKYLSAALGVSCNTLALVLFAGLFARLTQMRLGWLGAITGLCVLARPNLLLAVPFTAAAVALLARSRGQRSRPLLLALLLGGALALLPMAARNLTVTGRPSLFPSHGGGIPFYIGNNPASTGLWNSAGGLLSGQVALERQELASQLGLDQHDPNIDAAIGGELYARGARFIREQPGRWLALEAKKLWYLVGNHEFVHDYDWLGERELLGLAAPLGLPFGLLLGLGTLGLWSLARGTPEQRAMCVFLCGPVAAVVAANLVWFTSAQNRLPLVVPLAFASGPGAKQAYAWLSGIRRHQRQSPARHAAIAVCTVLAAQAFVSRHAAERPSPAHYFNLATVEEELGRNEAALAHYRRATERSPSQPMFWFRRAYLARRTGDLAQASNALDHLLALPTLPAPLRQAAEHERQEVTRASEPGERRDPAPSAPRR